MTEKEFFNTISNGKQDVLQVIINLLAKMNIDYCLIGGLAVNAYVEPVVSLDVDLIIEVAATDNFLDIVLLKLGAKVERFTHSLNITSLESDLRIQIQTDQTDSGWSSRVK